MLKVNRLIRRFCNVHVHTTKLKSTTVLHKRFESTPSTTKYSDDIVKKYAKLKTDMHYLFDGLQSTIISQLQKHNKQCLKLNDTETSQMKVIDIGCGDGNYSRCLSDTFDYSKIIGVDISEAQIKLAKNITDPIKYPNIEYDCFDACTLNTYPSMKGQFDIALSVWFYDYAPDKQILLNYIESTHAVMKTDGFLIGVTVSIQDANDISVGVYGNDSRFNMSSPADSIKKEGIWTYYLGSGDDPMEMINYLYEMNTYQECFKKVGFSDFRFLELNEYIVGQNSTKEQQQLFKRFISDSGCSIKIFIAQK